MFTLTIDTENAAFGDDETYELARLVHKVAYHLEAERTSGPVLDSNGNTVGQFTTEEGFDR